MNNDDSTSFQISTSSNIWPSENYVGTIAEKYEVKYNASIITYHDARDIESSGVKPWIYDNIKEHISGNYLKVKNSVYLEN